MEFSEFFFGMALSMNSVGIRGGFRPGFQKNLEFGAVSGDLGLLRK